MERTGYTATKHQREVGTGYFDKVSMAISGGHASTLAYGGSTEAAQFDGKPTEPVEKKDARGAA
jgi:isocitrate lyase